MRRDAYPEIGRRITISQGTKRSRRADFARLTRANGNRIADFALNDPRAY
jgi:hypothetical protein